MDYFNALNVITSVLKSKRGSWKKEPDRWQHGKRRIGIEIADSWDGERGHKVRNGILEAGSDKELGFPSRASRKECTQLIP